STASACDSHPRRIDVTSLENLVDAGHQILVVVAGIMELDDVAELLAVGRAAARIGVEHDVTLGRHPVEFVRERVAVRCVRPAVYLENERIFFRRVEMRWLQDPALNPLAV